MPAGATAATAVLLPFNTVDTFDIASDPDQEEWFRLEPTVTGSYRFKINKLTGPHGGYCDIYRLTGIDPPGEPPWDDLNDWVGWCGDDFSGASSYEESCVELLAGEVYFVACYDIVYDGHGTFTLEVEENVGPANDRVVNAIALTTPGESTVSGSTAGGSQEFAEFDIWDGSQAPSVWYKVVVGGPGEFVLQVSSTTPGFNPKIDAFYNTGAVTGFSDLTYDANANLDIGDGTENPPEDFYDQTPNTMGFYAPLEGGEEIWLRVSSYDSIDASDFGSFTMTLFISPVALCLDAVDYLGSSSTASIVSGSVRESQRIDGDWGATPKAPFEGFIGDGEDTLSIPGADILDGATMGFYSVTIKTKNSDTSNWMCGMKRNDQPLWPGAILDSGLTGTPVMDWLTMRPGSQHPNEMDMVKYLPVHPTDTIEIVMEHNASPSTRSIDITEICFQRILNAVEGPAYDILDIPDYPLGLVESELATADQAGDLLPEKGTAPAYKHHRIFGYDMCVTDDGDLWVAYNARATLDAGGDRLIGPCLMRWSGSSWSTVNNDIEGLGFKRTGGTPFSPFTISMDTDGTDIWMCYGVDDGAATFGGGRKVRIRVKKYSVGGGSFSNVGGLISGINTDVGGSTDAPNEYTRPEAGSFGDIPIIRVSPNGVPWVGFIDWEAAIGYEGLYASYARMPYVAQWTGSAWNVKRLPQRSEFTEPTFTILQAKDYRVASGTTSEVTYLSEAAVKETQTAYTNDTCSFVPPAGKWMFRPRVAKDYISGAANGLRFKWFLNGSPLTGPTDDGNSGTSGLDIPWTRWGSNNSAYADCNGTSDTISLRLAVTGGGVVDVYVDELIYFAAEIMIQSSGFGINAAFVDDGQPHVGLFMHQVGDSGLGENPGALYQTSFTVPQLDDPAGDGYWAPNSYPNESWNYQTWVYSEWNGSEWVRLWQKMVEDDVPDHVYVVTRTDDIASTPPLGHFQQGFGFCTDGIDNYMTANLGGGQAFGFFGDTIVALKIGATGFVSFTEGPPGHLQGPGYPLGTVLGLVGFSGWGWDTQARSICVDPSGNVWIAWDGVGGATGNYTDFVGHAVPNGLGGWFAASLTNEDGGYDAIIAPQGVVCSSPDGMKIYICWDTFIYSDGVLPTEPETFGVWECDVISDAKIPLIPIIRGVIDLTRIKFRGFQIGDA